MFNWQRKELPSHTTTPKKILWRELLHRDWEAARLRLTLYPGDVFYSPEEYDHRHRRSSSFSSSRLQLDAERHRGVTTCLHMACRIRSPLDILERILDLYPAATRRQDAEGWTPLHAHILHGSVGTVGNPSREAEFIHVFQMLLHMSLTRSVVCSIEYSPVSVASIHAHTTAHPCICFVATVITKQRMNYTWSELWYAPIRHKSLAPIRMDAFPGRSCGVCTRIGVDALVKKLQAAAIQI